MNSKEYVMPDGKKAVFEYDHDGIGKVTIEAMDMLMGLIADGRKHGEWIETSDGTMCGNCHKFPYDDGEYHIANWYSDFCPNCGADMREREGE